MSDLILQSEALRLTFSASDGALKGLEDKRRGVSYLDGDKKRAPYRLFADGKEIGEAAEFSFSQEEGGLTLRWTGRERVITAHVALLADGAAFRAQAEPLAKDASPCCLEYPILSGLVSRGEQTWLAHSWATGVLLRDPASFLPETGALRFTPYPESFSGASMQLMALWHEGLGGLYLAAHDGDGHQKWLNAYTEDGALALSHMTGLENLRPGAPTRMTYDFVLRLTGGDGWEEAAEMYREFALAQRWCKRGPLAGRKDRADWLTDEMGYCTFGINAGHDRSLWLKRYRKDIGCKGFHVLGPDWTNKPQTFGSGVPGGMEDWLPTRFSKETLRAVRENGDRFAPFEFDFLVDLGQHQQKELQQALQRFPQPTYSHDAYHFHMLCPCETFTRDFHRERDVQVQRESDADAMYYDISANNLIKVCTRTDHDHTPGGGREITEGYREIYRDTAQAMSREAGRTIPLGTEQMCEVFLDRLDFYQARAWGQPCSTLETWPIREQMLDGRARMIPLFDMVYHEYGVVRMDGWGKLTEKIGEMFFDTVAKTYLWGGLYEINHEYSPMEEIDGRENPSEEHYFRFDPQHAAYSPERAAYLAKFAAARVGNANAYWAYGRMLPAPRMRIRQRPLTWYHYNHAQSDPSYRAGGSYSCPAVRTALYESPEGRAALFLTVPGTAPEEAALPLAELARRYPDRPAALYRFHNGETGLVQDFGVLKTPETADTAVTLSPREIYMLEIGSNPTVS